MKLRVVYQILLPSISLFVGLSILASLLASAAAERAAIQQIELQMETIARTLAEARYPLNDLVLRQIRAFSGMDLFVWDGEVSTSTLPSLDALPLIETAKHATESPSPLEGPITVAKNKYRLSAFRLPLRPSGTRPTVLLLYPEARWREILREAARPALGIAAVGGLAAVGIITAITLRLSKRIGRLQEHTKCIAKGDYRPIAVGAWDDEISDLCQSVNEMASELAALHESAKNAERLRLVDQVSGGLAHQLRNSIAGARLAIQVHLREQSQHAKTDALEVALRQLNLLEERLHGYLDLGNESVREQSHCGLESIVDEIVELFQPRCRHFHIDLEWMSPQASITIMAFYDQLHQLVVNLIDNAIDAAGPGGFVAVRLQTMESNTVNDKVAVQAILQVEDSGVGPDPQIAARLFEPFTTSKEGGVGLGLSIAARVAKAHGGTLSWYRRNDRTVFEVLLPCTTVSPALVAANSEGV